MRRHGEKNYVRGIFPCSILRQTVRAGDGWNVDVFLSVDYCRIQIEKWLTYTKVSVDNTDLALDLSEGREPQVFRSHFLIRNHFEFTRYSFTMMFFPTLKIHQILDLFFRVLYFKFILKKGGAEIFWTAFIKCWLWIVKSRICHLLIFQPFLIKKITMKKSPMFLLTCMYCIVLLGTIFRAVTDSQKLWQAQAYRIS